MLIEEVENISNNEETCLFCKGSGYHPDPSDEEIENSVPNHPVDCPYCHGSGTINFQ